MIQAYVNEYSTGLYNKMGPLALVRVQKGHGGPNAPRKWGLQACRALVDICGKDLR